MSASEEDEEELEPESVDDGGVGTPGALGVPCSSVFVEIPRGENLEEAVRIGGRRCGTGVTPKYCEFMCVYVCVDACVYVRTRCGHASSGGHCVRSGRVDVVFFV